MFTKRSILIGALPLHHFLGGNGRDRAPQPRLRDWRNLFYDSQR
jgi:hypothetical protein